MDEIILNRLREVCPVKKLEEMDVIEVEEACNVAFKIIGYESRDFDKAFNKAWESSETDDLSDFIFDVWRLDR